MATTKEERIAQHNRQVAIVRKDGELCVKIHRDDFELEGKPWNMALYLEFEEIDHIKGMVEEFKKPKHVEVPA